jgi:hypothetical protein
MTFQNIAAAAVFLTVLFGFVALWLRTDRELRALVAHIKEMSAPITAAAPSLPPPLDVIAAEALPLPPPAPLPDFSTEPDEDAHVFTREMIVEMLQAFPGAAEDAFVQGLLEGLAEKVTMVPVLSLLGGSEVRLDFCPEEP